MSIKIIEERLKSYQATSWQEEEMAVKEIYQEIALAALARGDFFKQAIFQGGTALRILYSLDRFSEDLDFLLKESTPDFTLQPYYQSLQEEFQAYGIPVSLQDKSKVGAAVHKLFVKQESTGLLLAMQHRPQGGRPGKIQIKIEVDTNPPLGNGSETKFLDFPFAFGVVVQDLPSLFAGKSHALLCREYVKGRDWYDFLWYVARKTPINFAFLSHGCRQNGLWKGQKLMVTKSWFIGEMKKKIQSIDWNEAKNDVQRFLKPHEQPSLQVWGEGFFLDRLEKMEFYLNDQA